MTDEAKGAEGQQDAGKQGEGKKEEGKKEEGKKEEGKQEAQQQQQFADSAKMAELERKAKIFDQIDKRYRDDPAYREVFDKAWKGEVGEKKNDEGDEVDPIEQLRAENKKTKEDLENFRTVVNADKFTAARGKINTRYEGDFQKMAAEVGYEPGSPAFDILYSDTVREGYALAAKFGLVTESGDADPLKGYSPEFMKEAFKVAFDKQKRAGFDKAWQQKKENDEREKKSKGEGEYKDDVAEFFKPEKLKTPSDRARALELAFRKRFKGQNLKMV